MIMKSRPILFALIVTALAMVCHAEASVEEWNRKWEEDIPRLNEEIAKNPRDPKLLEDRAWAYFNTGEYEKSIADQTRVLELEPDFYPALAGRAEARVCLGQFEEAIADAERAAAVEKALLLKKGTPPRYIQQDFKQHILESIAKERKRLGEEYGAKASAEFEKENYEGALRLLDIAIRYTPEDPRHYNLRGLIHGHTDNWDKSVGDFTAAMDRAPDNGMFVFNRGLAYKNLGQAEKAAADFEYCLTLKPSPRVKAAALDKLDELRRR